MLLTLPRYLATLLAILALSAFPAQASVAAEEQDVYEIDFPGGTVGQYVDIVRAAQPRLNIILMPDAAEVRLPEIKIKTPFDAGGVAPAVLGLLEHVTKASRERNIQIDSDGLHHIVRLEDPFVPDNTQRRRAQEAVLRSHSLADVLVADHLTAEDVLQSIEAVLDLHGSVDFEPELRFHEPTSLLIIRGREEQLFIIDSAIHELRKTADVARVRRDQEESEHRIRQLRRREAELQGQIMEQDRIIADLRRQVEHLTAVLQGREQN